MLNVKKTTKVDEPSQEVVPCSGPDTGRQSAAKVGQGHITLSANEWELRVAQAMMRSPPGVPVCAWPPAGSENRVRGRGCDDPRE